MKQDFGASHNFERSKEIYFSTKGKSSKKEKRDIEEMKVSKTMYFKIRHFNFMTDYAKKNEISISQAFDNILQLSIAYLSLIECEKESSQLTQK